MNDDESWRALLRPPEMVIPAGPWTLRVGVESRSGGSIGFLPVRAWVKRGEAYVPAVDGTVMGEREGTLVEVSPDRFAGYDARPIEVEERRPRHWPPADPDADQRSTTPAAEPTGAGPTKGVGR